MATVRAKFTVQSVTRQRHWDRSKNTELNTIRLSPVTATNAENAKFYEAPPAGSIEIGTINDEAAKSFPLGGEVYVDFTPVEST
jgi:hypothetical protein